MRLSHDSEGFLTGSTILDIKRANDLLKSIRSDIAAIKRAMVAQNIRAVERSSQTAAPASSNRSSQRFTPASNNERPPRMQADNSVTPNRATNASNRTTGPRSQNEQGEVTPQAGVNGADQQPTATPNRERARDASGRFMADDSAVRERSAEPNARRDNRGRFTSNGEGDEQSQRTLLNGLADRIATAVTDSSTGLEEVDPTVRAFNEVAEPLARGYQALFSGEKDDVRWYRRIFGELCLFRKDDSAFNKATRRSLREIEGRQTTDDNDGGSSFFGGLLGSILPWLLGAIAGLGPLLLTGIKSVFGGFGLILRTVLAGIFSPIGLTIGAAATAAWGMFTEDGRKFFASIGPRISAAWDNAVNGFKESFPGIAEKFAEVADGIAALWKPIADFFKDKFGIVSNTVSKGVESVKSAINDKVLAPASGLISQGVESVKAVPKKLMERWHDAKQYLGAAAVKAGIDPGIVAKITGFESGFNSEARPTRKDGSRISSAHGYGQFLDATWTDMLNKYGAKYGVQNAGNLTKEEAAKLRSDKDLQASMLAEFTKENIEKGRALGGSNDDANVYALHNLGGGTGANFLKALKSNPNAPVNSIKGITNAVISGNKSLYGDGNITIQEAYDRMTKAMSRGEVFAKDITEYSRSVMPSLASMPKPVYASSPSPSIPSMPKPTAFADAPPLIIPMASDAGKRSINVTVERGEVSQDVSCRKIALIATGGLSGS